MRLLLSGYYPLLRGALRLFLESREGIEVVGEVATIPSMLEGCVKQKPDTILLDLCNERTAGLDALEQLRRRAPAVAVLMLSSRQDAPYVRQALLLGAGAYVSKSAALSEFDVALRALEQRQVFVSPGVSHALIGRRGASRRSLRGVLSDRQRQVLRLIASGHSTREIAQRIGVSVKTVETHRTRMMETLNVRGVHGLLRYALQNGLSPTEETSR